MRMRSFPWLCLASACVLALGAGCNQALGIDEPTVKESGPPGNESPDVSLDSGPDVSLDAGRYVSLDSGADVSLDSGPDASLDVGPVGEAASETNDAGARQDEGGDRPDVAEPDADASDARRDASLPDVSSDKNRPREIAWKGFSDCADGLETACGAADHDDVPT